MPAPWVELIRPPFYPGDRVPSWLRHQKGWHVVPTPGDGELLVPDSFDYVHLFPAGHVPPMRTLATPHDFSAWLPPPFRVLLLIALGILTFAADIHVLHRLGLDPWPLLAPLRNKSHLQALLDRPASKMESSSDVHDTRVRDESSGSSSSSGSSPSVPPPLVPGGTHYDHIYALGVLALLWALGGWIVFRLYVDSWDGDPSGRHAQTIQGVAVLGFLVIAVWPGDVVHRGARGAFGRALRRILSLSLVQHITFSDVILADVLTSFAKVLGDVWLTACFLVPRSEHHTWWSGRGSIAVPLLTSLPYAIRLRQCVSEYIVSRRSATTGRRSRRPLANAVKYASAFPVIWLSALQGADVGVGLNVPGYEGEDSLTFQFWLLAVFVNSLFSFWWDVTNDWGLDILRWNTWANVAAASGDLLPLDSGNSLLSNLHRRGRSSVSYGLGRLGFGGASARLSNGRFSARSSDDVSRPLTGGAGESETSSMAGPHLSQPHLRSVAPTVHARASSRLLLRTSRPSNMPAPLAFPVSAYQAAVLLDLLLRLLWSLKLSSHLHHVVELEQGILLLECLEVARRAGWVVLRVEWEHVKARERGREADARIEEGRGEESRVRGGGLDKVTEEGAGLGASSSSINTHNSSSSTRSAADPALEMDRLDAPRTHA